MGKDFQQANLFDLSCDDIQVTYSSSSIKGSALLSHRDRNLDCQFRGEEVRSVKTDIGELLTVTIEDIADARVVTFTMILPVVTVMPASPGSRIEIPGITTITHMTIAGPTVGPEKTYSQVILKGTAQTVFF